MQTAQAYLEALQDDAYRLQYGMELAESSNKRENVLTFATEVSQHFGHVEVPADLLATGLEQRGLMQHMTSNLLSDAAECISDQHAALLDHLALGFLPTGRFDAYVLNRDDAGERLDGYVIGLSYGLFSACSLLAEAIVIEQLQGELAHLRGDGAVHFCSATEFMHAPTLSAANSLPSLVGNMPEEHAAEVAHYVGALQAIMLTFVLLHELGHIAHGDVDSEARALRMADDYVPRHACPPELGPRDWDVEYHADAFALDALWHRSQDAARAWSNFAQVELLFRFLDVVGRSDPYHPPPLSRLERLREQQARLAGPAVHDYSTWLAERVETWSLTGRCG